MELLITGTDGFMGQVLKEYLQARGHNVCGTAFVRDAYEDELHFDIRNDVDFVKLPRYIERSGLPYTILRLPAVLGKNDTYISPAIITRLQEGAFYFCGKGDKLFSTLYVKNLPPVIEKIIAAGPLNDAFNCADHHMPWQKFIGEYAKVLNVDPGDKKNPF